jgi:Ca2+-binding RTX toxin-like protein
VRAMRRPLLAVVPIVLLAWGASVAAANTSHDGWPRIDGVLRMHKQDQSTTMRGTTRNDELLGGHGNDDIWGRGGHDVIWGDYKPGGQPTAQVDHLHGGAGNEFIYASHGRNVIDAGAGDDTIHAHFGHGSIACGAGTDTLFISHRARKGYKISGCETISYKTLGY